MTEPRSLLATLRLYVVPGLVFQAVVMGAGYATGRELVQFFMQGSLATGLAGMAVTALVWSLCLAIAFELAREMASTDYRSFLKMLIGPFWFLYEICFAALLLVILSVLGSAAGEIVASRLGWSPLIGIVGMMIAVCALVFLGTSVVERFLAAWSMLLYVLFVLVLILCLAGHGSDIAARVSASSLESGWLVQGVTYAGYNVAIIPGILYCARRLTTRRDALIAGAVAGPVAIIPAVIFFLSMTAFWPEIAKAPVPIDLVLQRLNQPWLSIIFYVALFGIFIKTGAALVHAVNERIATNFEEGGRRMPGWFRPVSAVVMILVASAMAEYFGIVALIESGYWWLTMAFLLVFVGPLIAIGGWRILNVRPSAAV